MTEKTRGITKTISIAALALALLGVAAGAQAQDREGRWEFTLGTLYQLGADLNFEGDSTMTTDNEFTFVMGGGYNFSDKLAGNFQFQYASVGYDATVFDEDGAETGIWGAYDAFVLSANALYHFIDGPLTPYVGVGIGWSWIDTNVPNGPPQTGCWWDPWWGWVCYTSYPTKTKSTFSYQATVGMRYEFNYSSTFLRMSYTSQWMDFDNATSTPRFDVVGLEVGWIF